MPNETTPNDGELIASLTELHKRDPDRYKQLSKLLGIHKPTPENLTRGQLKRYLAKRLGAGATPSALAEELNVPASTMPAIISTVMDREQLSRLKTNQAEMMATLAGCLAPHVLMRLEELIADKKTRPGDVIKAADLIAKVLQVVGSTSTVNATINAEFAPVRDIQERYDGPNLKRLLEQKETNIEGESGDSPELAEPDDQGGSDRADEGERNQDV